MRKIEISNIEITIGDQKIPVSMKELEQLKRAINQVLPEKGLPYVPVYPSTPAHPFTPFYIQPWEITCTNGTSADRIDCGTMSASEVLRKQYNQHMDEIL